MEGSFRYILLVLATAIAASLLQGLMPRSLFGSPFFGGLSGVVYGVFGFLLVKGHLNPRLGVKLSDVSVVIMIAWLVLGFADVVKGMANMAHLGGFVAGIVIGYFNSLNAHQ
jgi:GlpG protein